MEKDNLEEDINDINEKDDLDDLDKELSTDSMEDEDDGRMDLIRTLTTFDKDIQQMVSGWLGFEWDEESKSMKQSKYIKPVCNMHCASWCINHLRTYLRQTNTLINPTEQDYKEVMADNINLIYGAFGVRHKEFGLETGSDIKKVATQMLHSIRFLLSSTRNGGISKLIKDTHQQKENIDEQNKNKQASLMSKAANFLNNIGGR